jgi:hypothetical protein
MMIKPKQARESDVVHPVLSTLGHPMKHFVLMINPKGGPELIENLLIPIVLEGHKRQNAPLIQVIKHGINFSILVPPQLLQNHMLMNEERRFCSMLTILVEN